jgi:hypothetical protein
VRAAALPHVPLAPSFVALAATNFPGEWGNLTDWQRHAPAKGKVVSMKQHVLSCPECGEPMRYAFRKVCRQCGANLVMMPQRFHWNHMRVFVQGPRATLYTFTSLVIYLAFAFAVLIAVRVVMNALK